MRERKVRTTRVYGLTLLPDLSTLTAELLLGENWCWSFSEFNGVYTLQDQAQGDYRTLLKGLCHKDISVKINSTFNSLVSAITFTQNTTLEVWGNYQTNFTTMH